MDYYSNENIGNKSGTVLFKVAKAICDIHIHYWNEEIVTYKYRELLEFYNEEPDIQNALLQAIKNYEACPTTLTHDDLLPINVLCKGDEVRIIDWCHAKRAPYFQDLARLIAHLDGHNKNWFAEEDISLLLEEYYKLLTDSGIPLDKQQYQADIQSGILLQLAVSQSKMGNTVIGNQYLNKMKSLAQTMQNTKCNRNC